MMVSLYCTVAALCLIGLTKGQYVVDMSPGLGRRFDGIGGLSGGGATSKLFINYPEKERNEILDYLFLPGYAASLQILKVEIGGDSQSTDGTESSHMHEPDDENYQRGYEWWLMQEAKKRNPNIKLFGLPWAFPGWLGEGGQNPYVNPNKTSAYITKWILGAKTHYNLTIDYVGIWNERNYDITYIKTLRKMLDDQGLQHVRICAADGGWGIAKDMLKDQELMAAVDFIGVHYPGTTTTAEAVQTTKQLWSSEDFSTFNDNVGAGCWARILNQNYVNGNMTSTISWNLIAAYYQDLPFGRDGLMTATEPWSGHYVVESPIWITAHTTQFTDIGWNYLRQGSGAGHLQNGGSYVSLVSPDGKDLTIVVETMSHDHSTCIRPGLPAYNVSAQLAKFQLKGAFASISHLTAFYSKLGFNGKPSIMFEKALPVPVTSGSFSIYMDIDMIVTLTTLTRGQKGQYGPPPPSKEFPLPYHDTFDGYKEYQEAANFVAQIGVFEIRKTGDSRHENVNMQVMLHRAVDWCQQVNRPIAIGGNYQWKNVVVGVDAFLPTTTPANATFVAALISNGGCQAGQSKGVFFFVNPTNQTFQVTADIAKTELLKEGSLKLNPTDWYRQVLTVKGDILAGSVDGKNVFSLEIRTDSKNGFVGYGTDSFGYAMFDNFMVEDSSRVY